MTALKVEWTGNRFGNDADEERGLAAAETAIKKGADWHDVIVAFHGAMTKGWANADRVDNYILTTQEMTAAAHLMDDDIREDIHDDSRAEDPIWFLSEYRRRHVEKFGEEFVV
jgi:hypothetical protein